MAQNQGKSILKLWYQFNIVDGSENDSC